MVHDVDAVDPVDVADGDCRKGDPRLGGQLGAGHNWVMVGLIDDGVQAVKCQVEASQKESQPLKEKSLPLLVVWKLFL